MSLDFGKRSIENIFNLKTLINLSSLDYYSWDYRCDIKTLQFSYYTYTFVTVTSRLNRKN